MATWSKKISSCDQEKIVNFFAKNINQKQKNKYLKFFHKQKDLTISLFTNNTLLLQGSGDTIEKFKSHFFNINSSDEKKKFKAKLINCNNSYIGCDEVGVGDYYGPIVTCACYLKPSDITFVKNLSIIDSKLMSDHKILKSFEILSKKIKYQATICDNKTYNRLHDKYKNNKIILTFLHNKTLISLKKNINDSTSKIIMDEFTPAQIYDRYLKIINPKISIKIDSFQTKAEEKFLSVACASVIARALFLFEIKKMEKLIKKKIPLGANKKEEIINLGIYLFHLHKLDEFAKLDFKPITNKIINK